jgi:hypothetical protein
VKEEAWQKIFQFGEKSLLKKVELEEPELPKAKVSKFI